jgi:hypothetical protein
VVVDGRNDFCQAVEVDDVGGDGAAAAGYEEERERCEVTGRWWEATFPKDVVVIVVNLSRYQLNISQIIIIKH